MRSSRLAAAVSAALFLGPAAASSAAADCAGLNQAGAPGSRPWAQQRLDYERLASITTGAGVTVGVVDSGVDAAAPQLSGRVEAGWSAVDGGPGDTDQVGHGTFVAGIIAAAPRSGIGFVGVAPGAAILPVRETDATGGGSTGGLARAIVWAADHGAGVLNVSVTSGTDDPQLRDAVAYAVHKDVVVVAAAGNDGGTGGNATQYPAAYPGVLAVGAINQDGSASSFSSTGESIGVVAPGADLASVGASACQSGPTVLGGGTSFATPFVSGTAALVRAYHPSLTAAEVIRRIEATADRPAATRLPDPHFGWGVVDPVAAVTAILPQEAGIANAAPIAARLSAPPARAASDTSSLREAEYGALGALVLAAFVAWYRAVARGSVRRHERGLDQLAAVAPGDQETATGRE